MKFKVVTVFLLFFSILFSQEETNSKDIDSLYKEDQFYISVTYNLLGNLPDNAAQSGFSSGFHFGYIKDMPINKNRNVSIGLGLGYSANSYNHNLLVNKDNSGNFTYEVLNDSEINYSKNKFSAHAIEVPLEFRWRTSTASEYKFWRIYTGFKIGYVFTNTSKFKGDLGTIKFSNNSEFNEWQYGLSLAVGYNTWNMFLFYSLNPILSNQAMFSGDSIDMNAIKIGLIFYIL